MATNTVEPTTDAPATSGYPGLEFVHRRRLEEHEAAALRDRLRRWSRRTTIRRATFGVGLALGVSAATAMLVEGPPATTLRDQILAIVAGLGVAYAVTSTAAALAFVVASESFAGRAFVGGSIVLALGAFAFEGSWYLYVPVVIVLTFAGGVLAVYLRDDTTNRRHVERVEESIDRGVLEVHSRIDPTDGQRHTFGVMPDVHAVVLVDDAVADPPFEDLSKHFVAWTEADDVPGDDERRIVELETRNQVVAYGRPIRAHERDRLELALDGLFGTTVRNALVAMYLSGVLLRFGTILLEHEMVTGLGRGAWVAVLLVGMLAIARGLFRRASIARDLVEGLVVLGRAVDDARLLFVVAPRSNVILFERPESAPRPSE